MKKIILLPFLLILFSCQRNRVNTQLVQVDSLFQREQIDSAVSLLGEVVPSELGRSDMAYYYLLRIMGMFKQDRPIMSLDVLDQSIAYFQESSDYNHLAMAYVYKSGVLSEKGDAKGSVYCLKEAESLLDKIKNTDIIIRTYVGLAYENEYAYNHNKALYYGRKALNVAREADNHRWLGYCNDFLGALFSHVNMMDSCNYYQEAAAPYFNALPPREQVMVLSNQALFFWRKDSLEQAEQLLKRSLSIYPTERVYGQLAELYTIQGKRSEAERFWKSAMRTNDLELRIMLMLPYADWLSSQGRKEEGWITLKEIPALKDSLAYQRQAEAIKEVQDGYDREMAKLMFEKNLQLAIAGIVFLVLILLLVWMSYRLKSQKAKKKLAENQVLIAKYTTQIKQLVKEGKDSSKEVRELQRKIDAIRDSHIEMLYKGKDKYDEIIQGGNTLTWHKSDFNDVIEYYRSVDLPFVLHLEQEYRSLSASDKFFLLLKEIGMQEEEIQQIMGLTDGALRTKRSRIKEKEIQIGE